ncbi:hypothetical protein L3X37_09520 [Sabulilitoribacter arenilitoris]|uniref:Intradiol ring-cleavage dioxygenases domain-containing protein n=1 Tax=Wocania arenilitoris TaxID=2044858 RepID=A0AAE3ENC8_9FLAO|nr:hypothetical protein [Wocania arenilitoris]MCF7568603.1 hypothetical protein [Wocania arenilitoris]
MKNTISLISLLIIISLSYNTNAQDVNNVLNDIPQNYKKRSPIYDYSEKKLNSVDTIPDFAYRTSKLKITGTIYENDGKTPAKNILLFIHQANENGNFELKKHNKKRYVKHRGWVRTDENGRYTFYTFIPGKYMFDNELTQILPIIKEPNKTEYKIESFVFDNDPLLTKSCRSKIEQTNPNRILKLDKKEGLFVANRDIILGKELEIYE